MSDLAMSDDHRIAIIVDPALSPGFLANTVAVLGVGLGAAQPGFGNVTLTDAASRQVKNSADRAGAGAAGGCCADRRVAPQGSAGAAWRHCRAVSGLCAQPARFSEYKAQFPTRDLSGERIEGLGLAGPARWVKSLTGALKLLR